jgi:hypothetical protein
MSNYDKEQKSEFVKQHKRMAMGVPLNGQSMQAKDQPKQEPKLLKKK